MAPAVQSETTPADVAVESSQSSIPTSSIAAKTDVPRERMLWSDVMSDSGDSTEAPDGSSIDEGNQSGIEQAESTGGYEQQLGELPVPNPSPERRSKSRSEWAIQARGLKPHHKKPPASTEFVVGVIRFFLQNCMSVQNVIVEDKTDGSRTEKCITVELSNDSFPPAGAVENWILEPSRQALLAACNDSDNVYVLGYALQPFKNYHDLAFKCTLGVVTAFDKLCWDTYQYGACPRRTTCCWKHPGKADLIDLTVQVKISA